ncbi:hypothetical protein G6M50_01155 [Agrobacterium rhizogenes]|uniref:Tat pathway signal protein n=2 Tax=unclassified Rhizobium TaxID=2613769 RepID=A0AAU7S7J4_9HYPH|nr:hypothetical protein [Rhizobium rhizogenes]NTJ76399.1 hypothetical protein [Rhizobium rhizogenes]
MLTKTILALAASGLFATASCVPAVAQDANATAAPASAAPVAAHKLNVELNALAPSQKGCMMTFVAENDMATPINKISFELAFFNDKNAVDRVTVLDFRDLPLGKKRVRQFDMPGVKCETVSRIIINDTPVCDGPAAGECKAALTTRSQISVPFEG